MLVRTDSTESFAERGYSAGILGRDALILWPFILGSYLPGLPMGLVVPIG